ncbi:hypothetical protein LTR16_001692 [Cryomyces antarcticus]|uniref:Major facilitator superfamily (MFS) profile domain-containing protein n=1 Tax=Cryomyces antarcticus TaxID=329879 RepID=A0ABR0LS53_9PEZI|nr:hypothetical protein LTR60_000990 [Cryomyces antarcticus]KAK5201728.1 hypothetical protein LTR16_001692 [Cryomyces antarcticus]
MAGVGAAGVFTISIIIVLELTGSKRRGLFVGLLNTGYTIGVALGAIAAGGLLQHVGWRALFWMQSPMALMAGICLLFSIPTSFTAGKGNDGKYSMLQRIARIDYIGAVTLTSSLVLLLLALSSAKIPILPIILSAVLLIVFVLNEAYFASEPVIPVTVLKSRGVLLSCASTLGFMAARWMVLFYTPVYAIAVRGWSPATAGSILIPTNSGFAIGGLVVGWLHIRRAGSFYITFANGLCVGASLNYTLAHILHLTLPQTHFIVTSLIATFRGFAGSFGSAVGGGIFARLLRSTLEEGFKNRRMTGEEELIRKLMGSPATVTGLQGAEKDVAVEGYVVALRGLFLAGAGLAALMILVQAGTGWRAPMKEIETDGEEE